MSAKAAAQTLYRRQLGMQLRKLRTDAGLLLHQAAEPLEINPASLSRIENAERGTTPVLARALLDRYGVTDTAVRDHLLNLVRADTTARKERWWRKLGAVLSPTQYDGYLAFEASARRLRSYQPSVVPGLLQTEPYARAVITAVRVDLAPEQVEELVAVRMTRQRILHRTDEREPTHLWAVLDEAALRRTVGDPRITAGQLARLIDSEIHPHVTVQVVPFDSGAHAGLYGPFVVMDFPEPHPPVVALENLTSSLFLEEDEDVGRYRAAFDHLRAEAASPSASRALITRAMKELQEK